MNQRQNSPSEATYAQCGRQHFHPTFAVAISAGSMISAGPKEQWPHPERKGRVTKVHPERTNHPSEVRGKGETYFYPLAPGPPPLEVGEKSLGVPSKSGTCVPTDAHIRLSQGASPLAWYFSPGGKRGSRQGSPCWGRAHRDGGPALPSPGQLVPTGQGEGSMWEEASWWVLSKCWG